MSRPVYKYDNSGFELVVREFHAEYADCGSHSILLTVDFELEELNKFLEQLGIAPIEPTAPFPPKENNNG